MQRTGRGDRQVKEPEWEMRRTGRGGIDGLKNRSGKCEGPARGIDRLKNQSGKCEGPTRGDRRLKEPEWEMRRTGAVGGDQRLFEKKSFFKKPKTSTKHY